MKNAKIDERDSLGVNEVLKELRKSGRVVMNSEKNRAGHRLTLG